MKMRSVMTTPYAARYAPELELLHNFIRWHAADELLRPWGTCPRTPEASAGRMVRHDRWSSCFVDVRAFSRDAVDICFIMHCKGPLKRLAVHVRVHMSQWALDERHASLTPEDVRAAAFRGFQTLLASPNLEPVEYVVSLDEQEQSDEDPEPVSNIPYSLQWNMSM